MSTKDLMAQMEQFGSTHYPLYSPGFAMGKGVHIKDTDGKTYIDAASGYGSVGLGHNHPRIMQLLRDLNTPDADGWAPVNVVPNAFPTKAHGTFLEHICTTLGYDRGLTTNGGAEANEAAIKLMRKWGYTKKGVPKDMARIVVCEGNFHGRTTTIVGCSSEPAYRDLFGPYAPNAFISIPFGDSAALKKVLEDDAASIPPSIVGFLVEPIQGESGVHIPSRGYLEDCAALCKKHNVVLCADEIQTGLGRTGQWLASWNYGVHPDLVVLGKTLGGGKQAVACVLGKNEHMVFTPGDHGSTYGGNFAAMAIANEAISIIKDEGLIWRAQVSGARLLGELRHELLGDLRTQALIQDIRGIGLMIGIETAPNVESGKIITHMLREGVMTKDAHGVIRITPPLIITQPECVKLVDRIKCAFLAYASY